MQSQAARYITYADLAWNIKLSFAIVMETCPLRGRRFQHHIWFWGILGTLGYFVVAMADTVPALAGLADWVFLVCLTLGVNAMVWNDTIVDGVAAEETKANPACGADVQAWQQFSLMGCAIAMSAASGFILDAVGVRGAYLIAAAISALSTIVGGLWLQERKVPSLGASATSECGARMCSIFKPLRQQEVWRLLLYWGIVSFNFDLTTAMVYWYDDVAHYSKAFQGFVVTIGWTMGIVGVASYTSVFKRYSYRNFLCGLQLAQAALSTLDWFLVVYAGDVSQSPAPSRNTALLVVLLSLSLT
jgi:hypothetical protein